MCMFEWSAHLGGFGLSGGTFHIYCYTGMRDGLHSHTYCTHKSDNRSHVHTYACHMLPCMIYTVCILLLTLFTANSAPLKYTMLMVPLPPFPILLSTASQEGRGRKDPSSKAAMLCVGEHAEDYTLQRMMKHPCTVNATLHTHSYCS